MSTRRGSPRRSIAGKRGEPRAQHRFDQRQPRVVLLRPRPQCRDALQPLRERRRIARRPEAAPHQLAQFVVGASVHGDAARVGEPFRVATCARALWRRAASRWPTARLRQRMPQPPAEHHSFEQRVAREAVRAVQARAGHFADSPQMRHAAAPVEVHGDPAHVVVRGTGHRNRLAIRIDAVRTTVPPGRRKGLRDIAGVQRGGIEPHAPAGGLRGVHDPGHDVAGREVAERMRERHHALASIVDQPRPRAAQRFGNEWQRLRRDVERGGMELHCRELRAARAGGERHRESVAAGHRRIGGAAVQGADSAARQHHVAGTHPDRHAIVRHRRHPGCAVRVAS